jgi:hypothetical protein
MAAENIFI